MGTSRVKLKKIEKKIDIILKTRQYPHKQKKTHGGKEEVTLMLIHSREN